MDTNEVLIKIFLTFLLTGMIGFQREAFGKPAGIRTHILVGLGSVLTIMTGIYINSQLSPEEKADVTRISAQVISGIGFLGAGTIMKKGDSIEGLTTGASLWLSGCVGIAIGSGFYFGAIVVTLTSMLLLEKSLYRRLLFKIKTRSLEIPPLTTIEFKGRYYVSISDAILSDEEMSKITFMTPKIYQSILLTYNAETFVKKGKNDKYTHFTGFHNADSCERAIKDLISRLGTGKLLK